MNEVMMVPMDEFNRLSSYYQGQMTESALLNKAGRLTADQHLILRDKSIPDSMAVKLVKPMALEQGRLVKRVRTGTAAPSQYEGTEEPEGMADAPIESMLKKIIKGVNNPQIIEIEGDETPVKEIKIERKTPKSSVKKKPAKKSPKSSGKEEPIKTTPKPSTSGSSRQYRLPKGLSEKAKGALKSLGFHEGEYSPKGASKPYKKQRKTEVDKLKENWESWNPVRKSLESDYDTDEESD